MRSRIPYSLFYYPPTRAFPAGRKSSRPLVRLTLANGPHRLSCSAILDSGADFCAFPLSLARPLGLDPSAVVPDSTYGLGTYSAPTYFHNVQIDLPGTAAFDVYAGFTEALDQWGFGLLGQTGFLERFKITFDLLNGVFEI